MTIDRLVTTRIKQSRSPAPRGNPIGGNMQRDHPLPRGRTPLLAAADSTAAVIGDSAKAARRMSGVRFCIAPILCLDSAEISGIECWPADWLQHGVARNLDSGWHHVSPFSPCRHRSWDTRIVAPCVSLVYVIWESGTVCTHLGLSAHRRTQQRARSGTSSSRRGERGSG
jgi:hypothetical protein